MKHKKNMDTNQIFIQFFTSALVGAIIGIEREKTKNIKKNQIISVGIRTDILIALLGATSATLANTIHFSILMISFIALIIFLLIPFTSLALAKQQINFKTEISTIIVFILGALSIYFPPIVPIITAIITTMILSMRETLHSVANKIKYGEIIDAIKFILIAFVILPFLPNKSYDQEILNIFVDTSNLPISIQTLDIINPYQIWLIVVVISGINFLGYILVRLLGKNKGISLTGFLGGFYSSTMTSLSLSKQSKRNKNIKYPFVSAITLACATSFVKMLIVIRTLNNELFNYTAPTMLLMLLYLLIVGFLIYEFSKRQKQKRKIGKDQLSKEIISPFKLKTAVQFAIILTLTL
ncbi:DUF4010 domain-containing protein, partial [Candidatus Peregrinibacteria bacterium]|nr:DUF4010 domain-containing protein [Candidatus Peregrinibacteria bacterium]